MQSEKVVEVYSGLHKTVKEKNFHYDRDESSVVENLGKFFYITTIREITIGKSNYKYMFVKFPTHQANIFGIKHEMLFLLSSFSNFELRTLDAIDEILYKERGARLDKICTFIASADKKITEEIRQHISNTSECRVVVPFSYAELLGNNEELFFINRIRDYFFTRNLFDFESPLRTDKYFFGRESISLTLVDAHYRGANSGLFGLRRSGKTSVLYSILRTLDTKGGMGIIIDCQKMHTSRWWKFLEHIVNELNCECDKKKRIRKQIKLSDYTEENAALSFERDINKICNQIMSANKKVLLIFDEIEHITFGISPSDAWKAGNDYIVFWQIIRAVFQSSSMPYTFLVAGTNPKTLETPMVNKIDNPLFQQIQQHYLESFTLEQTTDMITTLSKYMSISFDETIFTNLTTDYGGHPFMIRQVCSYLYEKLLQERAKHIDRSFYAKYTAEFNTGKGHKYCEMVISVLSEFYSVEYEMLLLLAKKDIETFGELADGDLSYTEHLMGYGILKKEYAGYVFNMNIMKSYLEQKCKYCNIVNTNEERLDEISARRNAIELKLRILVSRVLKMKFRETLAIDIVSKAINNKNKNLTYEQLFDPNVSKIYFETINTLMCKYWEDCFRDYFLVNVEEFKTRMFMINSVGRSDAHAKNVTDANWDSFRGAMKWLEEIVFSKDNEWLTR